MTTTFEIRTETRLMETITAETLAGVAMAVINTYWVDEDETVKAFNEAGEMVMDLETAEGFEARGETDTYTEVGFDPLDEPFVAEDLDGMTVEEVREVEAMVLADADEEEA